MPDVDQARATGPERSWSVLGGVLVLTAISVGGAVVSVRDGLSATWLDAVGPDGHLSIPLPMTALQVLAALAAASPRRRVALAGSGVLVIAVVAAVVSGLFDGGYADERLTTGQRLYQVLLESGLVVVWVLAAARFVRVWRAR